MFEMPLDAITQRIVSSQLPRNAWADHALSISYDVRVRDFDTGASRSAGIHLLYYCVPHGSQISVFSGVTDSPFDRFSKVETWKHETTHDSCWTSVNVFNQVYFEMVERLNNERLQMGFEKKAPKDFYASANFQLFGDSLFEWIDVKVIKDPNDSRGYKRVVTFPESTVLRSA